MNIIYLKSICSMVSMYCLQPFVIEYIYVEDHMVSISIILKEYI